MDLDIPEMGIRGLPAYVKRCDGVKYLALSYNGISLQHKRQLISFLYCEDGRWAKMNLSPVRAALIMFKSIFQIYPIESARRRSDPSRGPQ